MLPTIYCSHGFSERSALLVRASSNDTRLGFESDTYSEFRPIVGRVVGVAEEVSRWQCVSPGARSAWSIVWLLGHAGLADDHSEVELDMSQGMLSLSLHSSGTRLLCLAVLILCLYSGGDEG